MFNGTQGAAISGDALNVVHRDQYIGATTIINRVFHGERPGRIVVKKERKKHNTDSEYNQYREIIRGDINKFEQLSSEEGGWEWKDGRRVRTHSYRITIHQAQVYGNDSVFTTISYHGRDAKKIWKKEFMELSQADDPAVLLQLFAINHSNVPMLLFHDEWLPLGHLHSKMKGTFWEAYYLRVYVYAWIERIQTTWVHGKLWLNLRTGRVSLGPNGPLAGITFTSVLYNCEDMPSAMEMATADTCVRFFNQTGVGHFDLDVLQYASGEYSYMCLESLLGLDSPDDHIHPAWIRDTRCGPWNCVECGRIPCNEVRDLISKLRLDTVYSGAQLDKIAILKEGPTYRCYSSVLSDQTPIDSGLTRFQFGIGSQGTSYIDFNNYIYLNTLSLEDAWFSQAHRLDLPTSGSETCFIPLLGFNLCLDLRPEQFGVSDSEPLPIAYLFLRPPPLYVADIDSWSSHVSFWSFDENGTSEIFETECERLGLPNISLSDVRLDLRTWPKYVYDGLHAWQIARGFDPLTADWARSLGLPILEPAITRFEEVVEEEPSTCRSLPEPNANVIPDDPSASNQLSPLSTPPATRIPKRQAPKKRKRVPVVTIHDTDSESEPEASQGGCVKSSGTSQIQI